MRFYKQDRFGGIDSPPEERGNCDKNILPIKEWYP